MLSDTVWNDAFARAKAVCDLVGLPIVDPLLQNSAQSVDPYWMVPLATASSDRMGMGEIENEETGQIALVLMIPVGAMSTPDALQNATAMSAAFRAPVGDNPVPWPSGLFYDGQDFVPPDLDATGNWYSLQLLVSYRFQSAMTQSS